MSREVPPEKQHFPRWYTGLELASARLDLATDTANYATGDLFGLPQEVRESAKSTREKVEAGVNLLREAREEVRRLAVGVRVNVASGKDPLAGVGR